MSANTYPPNVQQFIEQELVSGTVRSESELITRALEVYRQLKGELRQDV